MAFFRLIPNLTIMAPKDFKELEDMMEFAVNVGKPVVIRYPRGGEGKEEESGRVGEREQEEGGGAGEGEQEEDGRDHAIGTGERGAEGVDEATGEPHPGAGEEQADEQPTGAREDDRGGEEGA